MKKLQNNFTTPEQSKRLLELGVPAWTADGFRWDFSSAFGISEDKRYSTSISVICYEYQRDFHDKLPCWSLGRLMEIFDICCVISDYNDWCNTQCVPNEYVAYIIGCYERATNNKLLDFSKLE